MVADDSLYLMTPLEIAWGYVPGHAEPLPRPATGSAGPREALEQVVGAALRHPPCGVAFSGGRDSSAVLAIATHVARREGLPDPLPITRVFPDAPAAEEDQWQELVVGHLGLTDWQRVLIHDELDVVGPLAAAHLVEHGVVWPPMIHADLPLLESLRGGSLIDGEGGDEVLGVAAHRVAPLTRLVRYPRPVRRNRVSSALLALAPARQRASRAERRLRTQPLAWLTPAAREPLIHSLVAVQASQPLSFRDSVRMVPARRTQTLMSRNRRVLAARHGVEVSSPLLDSGVVHALAEDGGMLGRGDRTAVLRSLVADLLPDAVLARTGKATFGEAYMGPGTRDFAAHWTGGGIDPRLVNPEELRRIWLSEEGNALTAALVQAAWLACRGDSSRPDAGAS
jgi:asparagine synthetase B (glutamine-hydrolysing)